MSRGPSGRIVVEIKPGLKGQLYEELAKNGYTLKDWFIAQAERYVAESRQPALFGENPNLRNSEG